jgi:CMP-N-acetylneuraminic acid synthetase
MLNKLVLAVIPARSGSKSIPRKNLQKIHNISLTKYALFSAQLNNLITHIALSSDSDEILNELNSFQETNFIRIKRPKELSTDESPDQPVLVHALNYTENFFNTKFDAVVMLQPTSPLRPQNDLNKCINNVLINEADSSWSVNEIPIRYHYKKQFEIINNKLVIATSDGHVPRRQDLENTYHRNGVCYVYKRSVVFEDSILMGTKCAPVISKIRTLDIDNYEDLDDIEELTLVESNQLRWK